MPIDGGTADSDGRDTPAPSVSCDFGPFGEQTQVNLKTLGTQKLCEIPLLRVSHSPLLRPVPFLILSLIDTAIVALPTAQFLP
jgi:hypothetical protein